MGSHDKIHSRYLKEAAAAVHLAWLHQCVSGHLGVPGALLYAAGAARPLQGGNTPFI